MGEGGDEHDQRSGRGSRLLGAAIVTIAVGLIVPGIYAVLAWNRDDPRVIWIPGFVLVWGFLGGTAAVLFELLYGRTDAADYGDGQREPSVALLVVCRPVLGAVVGAAAYLLAKAGVLVLTSVPQSATTTTTEQVNLNAEFFAGIAFLAGFADRATGALFRSFFRGLRSRDKDRPA